MSVYDIMCVSETERGRKVEEEVGRERERERGREREGGGERETHILPGSCCIIGHWFGASLKSKLLQLFQQSLEQYKHGTIQVREQKHKP